MKKDKKFIQGKVKPLQYGAKAISIHKNSITYDGDYFKFIIASKKDGSGDYMYLDEYTATNSNTGITFTTDSKKVINTVNDFGIDDEDTLPF